MRCRTSGSVRSSVRSPRSLMFLDRARIKVRGGDGGRGVISFRREAHVPRGAPHGRDGGNGGHLMLRAAAQLASLNEFQFKKEYRATERAWRDGGNGNATGSGDL